MPIAQTISCMECGETAVLVQVPAAAEIIEAGDILLCQIVDPADIPFFAAWDGEDPAEGIHLGTADDTVRLRHLRRERNHGDRERGLTAKSAVG